MNKAKIFGEELTADNLSKVHIFQEKNKSTQIVIDEGSNISVNVAATHQALAGKSDSSEFDIKIGENKVHYKINGKQVHADMGGMSKEVAASDEALKINLNDADAKYGKVSIQIDPNTMKPALVFDADPELSLQQMKEAQQDLVKIYGNDKKGGKNAAMSIKGEGAEIAFKDLALMSGNEMETKKSQIRGDELPGFDVSQKNNISLQKEIQNKPIEEQEVKAEIVKDPRTSQNVHDADNKPKVYGAASDVKNSMDTLINTQNKATQSEQNIDSNHGHTKQDPQYKYGDNMKDSDFDTLIRPTTVSIVKDGVITQGKGDLVAVERRDDFNNSVNRGTHHPVQYKDDNKDYHPGDMKPPSTPNAKNTDKGPSVG